MHEDLEKVKLLARDLRDGKEFPRSPRATLGGYVLAARAVDKCRAVLVDWQGEYHSNCPLDQRWLNFAEIHYGDFRSLVATGATDDEIAEWIEKNAKKRPRAEIVAWNNKERDLRLSDLPPELQEYMENYIHRYVPRNRVVYHWFDVYDLEEQRIRNPVGTPDCGVRRRRAPMLHRLRLLSRSQPYIDFGGQCPMNGTFRCDLHQSRMLF